MPAPKEVKEVVFFKRCVCLLFLDEVDLFEILLSGVRFISGRGFGSRWDRGDRGDRGVQRWEVKR